MVSIYKKGDKTNYTSTSVGENYSLQSMYATFLEKTMAAQPLKKFAVVYGSGKLITVIIRACHWTFLVGQVNQVHTLISIAIALPESSK
jgi:hypothetical protein